MEDVVDYKPNGTVYVKLGLGYSAVIDPYFHRQVIP